MQSETYGSGVVSKPHTVILNVGGLAFENLVDRKNFSCCLLQLVKLVKKVPKSTLGSHGIRSKHSHSVDLRIGIGLRRNFSSDNLEILLLQMVLMTVGYFKSFTKNINDFRESKNTRDTQ